MMADRVLKAGGLEVNRAIRTPWCKELRVSGGIPGSIRPNIEYVGVLAYDRLHVAFFTRGQGMVRPQVLGTTR
jgi:hypothetical protein